MGSDDQTGPWFIGLWRFYDSGLATDEEKDRLRKHLVETTEAIVSLGWNMPAEAPSGNAAPSRASTSRKKPSGNSS